MYSQSDVEDAVAGGAITAAEADALRRFVELRDQRSLVDDEQFRLLTSFNDIFVTIALILCFVAIGGLTGSFMLIAIPALCFAFSPWIVQRKRMALPSIVLVVAIAVAGSIAGAAVGKEFGAPLLSAGLLAVHYYLYRVPITPAVIAAIAFTFIVSLLPSGWTSEWLVWMIFVYGLATFALAMSYDLSDRFRRTRRSDTAFWLHLSASPAIIHTFFWKSGLLAAKLSGAQAAGILIIYFLLGIVALVIDRRAVLVSALAYALYAVGNLLWQNAQDPLAIPLACLVLSSVVLLLAANWNRSRRFFVQRLPSAWQARLPVLDRPGA